MRKLLALLLGVFLAVSAVSAATADSVQKSIVVDGDASDWEGVSSYSIAESSSSLPSPSDLSGSFRSAWDGNFVYFLVEVTDDEFDVSGGDYIFVRDAVEIYLDGGNEKATSYDSNDYQVHVRADAGNVEAWANANLVEASPGGVVAESVRTSDGYLLEVGVAWSFLGGQSPGDGVIYGFDLAVNDRDNEIYEDQIAWQYASGKHRDTSGWGNLQLSGAAETSSSVSFSSLDFSSSDSQTLDVIVSDTVIYDTGYYSVDGGNDWTQFSLSGSKAGSWVLSSASSSISLNLADVNVSGDELVAFYACSWSGGWDCHGNNWQIQEFQVTLPQANDSEPVCGNGIIESGENCDGTSLSEETCQTQGFDNGTLFCTLSCTFDTSGCFNNMESETGSVEGDHAALMDLYAATNGDGWWDNTGWESSTPQTMDSMYGITVYPDGHELAGRVKEIDLFQNNLVGTIESVPFDALTAVQRMTLKQPLTEEEFFGGNPDGQIATNPPPKLSGQLPASIGGMQNLQWLSLGGQYCRIDMSPDSWNEWNHCPGFGSGKKFVNGNVFEGQLPPEWGRLSKLRMLELRRSDVTGPVPAEWEGMTSLVGIYLNDNILNGNLPEFANSSDLRQIFFKHNRRRNTEHDGFTGPVPETYAQLENLNHLRLGYNSLSGELPVFDTATDIRTFDIDRNELTRFPTEIFQDGRNPKLNYVLIYHNPLGGRLADQPVNPDNHNLQYFAVSYTDMEGPVPSWASDLTVDLFNFDHNRFSSLDSGFYDADAPLWGDVRNVRLGSNELSGELPDVLFARLSHEGTVASMPSDTTIELNMDLGVVETGTVTTASTEWIQDSSKEDGQWVGADFTDHTVIIDPDGVNIQFEVLEDTNIESGYLYSRNRADPSGTEGLDYVIRPTVENRIIRFKLGDNRWVARNVESVDYANNRVTVDKPISQDVSGAQFQVHERGSGTYVIQFYDNHFTGPIPQSWGYIPTGRDVILSVDDNNLTGTVPDFTHVGINYGGSLNELSYQNNRFVFRDILPNFAENEAASNSHQYAPQKPFGQADSSFYSVGSTISLDDFESSVSHSDNIYQWEKDGSDINGATSKTLTINDAQTSDSGTYRLKVTNPGAPALTLTSEPIDITVS